MSSLWEDWWIHTPPVTRAYVTLSSTVTILCALDVLSPMKLYYSWEGVKRLQLWRIFTNFFYFGPFGMDFLFHMFFLYRYCKLLELNTFRGRSADFVFMLLIGGILLIMLSFFTPTIKFLGPSLMFMMVYVWARRNEHQLLNFLGLFNFRAPYLPWIFLGFSCMLGTSPVTDILGVVAGHCYYYFEDVYPQLYGGSRVWKTPALLYWVFGEWNNHPLQETQAAAWRMERGWNNNNNNNNDLMILGGEENGVGWL
jgi:Derlin-2/3